MIGLAVLLLILAGAVLWLLYGSPWLRVERVSVSGTKVLTRQEVRQSGKVPVGRSLAGIDTNAIETRLRRQLPRIDTVEVSRSWPGTVAVRITERDAVLLVEKGGKFVEVDDEGVSFARVGQAPKAVPLLELALTEEDSAGASVRRFGEERLVREAVRVAGDIPRAVARDTRNVKVRSYDDISLELTGGRTVEWGSSEEGPVKARTLTALMKAAPRASHFDVSVPTAPASSGS
jgi:cell division protein FtsQ